MCFLWRLHLNPLSRPVKHMQPVTLSMEGSTLRGQFLHTTDLNVFHTFKKSMEQHLKNTSLGATLH